MNGNMMRCMNAYFSANGKKSFKRMLFFNIFRCMVPEILKEFVFKGKIVIWEFAFVFCCAVFWTIFFHYLPMKVFKMFWPIYMYLQLEYYMKHASDWIENRNVLESQASHNACAFYLYLVLESNSSLRAGILEGLMYGELSILDIPYTIYDGTLTYIAAIPVTYLMQVFVLQSNLVIHAPLSIAGLWNQKRLVSGWLQVDMRSTEFDSHWLFTTITVALFISMNAWFDVYRRIKSCREDSPLEINDKVVEHQSWQDV